LPTAKEAGLPDVLLTTWTGWYAPKGTPREVVQKINADIRAAAADAKVLVRLESMGGWPKLMSPEEFTAFTLSEKERWGSIIRRANIRLGEERARQGSLRGNKGPRIRHVADEGAPFETITVDKLTPVIG